MRKIKPATKFKKDLKKISRSCSSETLGILHDTINLLAKDDPLPHNFMDHALVGDWKDFRDCHIRPDLILIYQKPNEEDLLLVRLGSHSELGL